MQYRLPLDLQARGFDAGLREHLGGAHVFLDIVADQAPNGLEYVAGAIDYTFDANWKLQFENGLDFYHFASTHSSYVDILNRRGLRAER